MPEIHEIGFYAFGFIMGGYLKSAITGGPVSSTLFIEKINKETGIKSRYDLPWIPELLGAAIIGGFFHYISR